MTREEAITTLKEMHDSFDEIHENTNFEIGYEQMTALDMAIEALSEPSDKTETVFIYPFGVDNMDEPSLKAIRKQIDEHWYLDKSDLISRADAIEAVWKEYEDAINIGDNGDAIADDVGRILSALPSADAVSREFYNDAVKANIGLVIENGKLKEQIESAETHEIRTETHGVCLISKDDAMCAVQDHFNANGFKGYDDGQKMMDRIKALPSADRPQGEWNKFDTGIYLCSNCNWAVGNEYNYCPCCGAKMERREP